jgi:hypothetical protein
MLKMAVLMTGYEEGDSVSRNRVSTTSQLGADSVGSEECVKSKMPHFLMKTACLVKDVLCELSLG